MRGQNGGPMVSKGRGWSLPRRPVLMTEREGPTLRVTTEVTYLETQWYHCSRMSAISYIVKEE